MGYSFDLTNTGGSTTGLPKPVPMRAAPVQSTWSQPEQPSSSFGRIDLTGAAVQGIQMAATAPGYIYDRPLAALNTIGKSKATDKGLIDQAGDTIRSIPILGDVLSGGAQAIGNTLEGSGRIFPALANSWMASALADNAGRSDDEKVDGLPAWFATSRGLGGDLTVGELRQIAAQRGFTPEDVNAVRSGQRSIYDWADKSISDNPLVDLTGRMVVDPMNLVAFGAAGAAAKGVVKGVTLGGRLMDGTTMLSRIDKLATGATALENAVVRSRVGFKGTIEGMRALRAGSIEGVTLNTLGRHLAMFSRGSSDFLRAYRKVAIGTTGAQLGLQEMAKAGVLDNTPLSPIMDTLYEAADRMANDKPLSDGMLFNLWAAVNFPIRDGLSDAWQSTRTHGLGIGIGKATLRTPLLRRITDIEKYIVKELAPGKSFAEGRKYLIGRFGSEDRFQDHIMHFARSLVTEDPNTAMPALTNQPVTSAEFQATAEVNNRVWDAATRARIEQGQIDGRAVFEHMVEKYKGTRSTSANKTGGTTEVTGRVEREWDAEDHIRQWNDWADRMEQLNLAAGFQKGGNLVIGIMDGLMPKEHLMAAKRTLEAIAGPDGIIPKNRMDEFLNAFPALDADVNDPSNFFARLRATDSGQVHVKAATQRIDRLMKDPRTLTMREYLHGVEQREKRAESIAQKKGTVLDENGMPDPTRAPVMGQAAVLTPTLKDSVRKQMGLDGLTLEDVHTSRGNERTRAAEDDLAAVIDESGFNLRAAVQGIVSRGGKKVTAVSLHLDSRTDIGSLELAGAIALRRTGADRATVLYSGVETLRAQGLEANAAHTRFDIGKMSSDEASRVLDAAVEAFDGQFELNDTAGVLHVVVKPGQEAMIQDLTDLIDGIVGRDRVSVSHEPAWFQVIRNDMRSGGRGRAAAGESSARAIFDAARGDLRLVNSERRFSERAIRSAEYATATSKGARDARGVLGETRPGFTRGPESARPGRDDLGADQPGGLKATRYGSPADVSKPQGAYMSLDGDMPSAHAELGDGTQYTVRPRNPIDVTTAEPPGASAGVRYLSMIGELDDLASAGGVEFGTMFVKSRGTAEGKATLLEQMSQRFPDVEWGRYKDSYEILEAYAGLRARANGHDVIINRDPVDPSFDEVVVLDGRAISDIPDAFRPEDSAERMGMRHLFWDELAGNPIPTEGPPPFDIRETIDFAQASDGVPEGSFRDPVIEAHDASGSQGQVIFLAEADDALDALTPRLTADLNGSDRADLGGLDPVQLEKIKGLETELRQYDPQYRIKFTPTQGNVATYYPGQGNAIKDLMATSRAASDLLTFKRWGKAAAFWDLLFRPVETSKLGADAKQALYRELLGRTAHLGDKETIRIKDIDSFLQTANAVARQTRVLGAQTYARGELLDIKTLAAIADGSYAKDIAKGSGGIFPGFTPEALAAIGGAKNIHKILDRTGSRFFRDLEKRTEDKGFLGEAIIAGYGGVRSKTATPRHYIRTWYHLFRFTFDPRFHILNHAEADVLGAIKYGWSTTRWGGARDGMAGKEGATLAHSRGGDMNADRLADALASGVLDARHLEGYTGRGFKVDRMRSTRDVLRTMSVEDPAIRVLREKFGGTIDELVDGLEQMMYDFDTKGVDGTIRDAAEAILDEADRKAMEPLLINLYERNRQIFKDVKSTFHGNTNRSNIERIMNSYFLYWPISYQLKAGKWLFDVLTKQSLGRKTNLGGAWYVNNLYQQHMERMARDENYQRMFTDNPALWFTASMLLPMTPWDMSVGMSRATRYMLAGVGIIDEPKFEEDPFMAAMRLAHIGPAYTIELAERMYRESKDKPRDLVVPVN